MALQDVPRVAASVVVPRAALQKIFDNLLAARYALIGPTVRDAAIMLEEISRTDELPSGWTDDQQPAQYRLRKNGNAYFDYNVGPQSWKQFLFPPRQKLYTIEASNGNWKLEPNRSPAPKQAFIGVRACELAAIAIQDRVFLGSEFRDSCYGARRQQIFVLAVNCSKAAATCFCSSMKTGPKVSGTFDLALTELDGSLLLEVGSEEGATMLKGTGWQPASAFDTGRAAQAIQQTERQIQRQMRTDDLPKLLYDNLEHARWEEVARRCLGCANCTLVCPTCFCSTVEDTSDLRGEKCERTRVWDSCFVLDFSHVHGGNIRPSIRARYRQWLTHKLGSWIDQFGTSGCVGCGRCITWCPVGIELTEEVKAIRERAAR
jgi:ferredoxin